MYLCQSQQGVKSQKQETGPNLGLKKGRGIVEREEYGEGKLSFMIQNILHRHVWLPKNGLLLFTGDVTNAAGYVL